MAADPYAASIVRPRVIRGGAGEDPLSVIRQRERTALETCLSKILRAIKSPSLWPTEDDLEKLTVAAAKFAATHRTGKGSRRTLPWRNFVRIEKQCPALRICEYLGQLTDRLGHLEEKRAHLELYRISHIARSASGKYQALAQDLLKNLRVTRADPLKRWKVRWEKYRDILFPPGEIGVDADCRARASEIELQWLRYWELADSSEDFRFWILRVGLPGNLIPQSLKGIHGRLEDRELLEDSTRKRDLARLRQEKKRKVSTRNA